MHKPLFTSLSIVAIALLAPHAAAENTDEVVAKMGLIEIRSSELQKSLAGLPASANLDREALRQALAQGARAELLRRAVLSDALRGNWDKRPEVQAEIERAREQVVVTSFVNDKSRPAANYPSEAELKAAYEANAKLFVRPPEVRIAQIYLTGDAKPDEVWKKATEKGADFAALARKHSKHAESAAKGGDMGWIGEEALVPEIRGAVKTLALGEVAKPVKSQSGWHIVRLDARKAAEQRPFAEVREQLSNSLRLQRAQENEQRYLGQLATDTPITINEIALTSLVSGKKSIK